MAYLCGFFALQKNIEKIWNFFEKSVDKQEMIWYNNQAVTWDSGKQKDLENWTTGRNKN